MLRSFVDLGGRQVIIDALFQGIEAISRALTVIGDAWSRVFPPVTAQTLFKMAQGFSALVDSMTMNQAQMNTFGTIFEGIFSALSAGITIIKEVAMALFQLIPDNLVGDLVAFLSHIARIPIAFNKSVQSGEGIIRVIRQIGAVFNVVGAVLGIGVRAILQGLINLNLNWNNVINGMVTALSFLVNAVVAIGTQIGNVLSKLFEGFSFDGLIDSLMGIGSAVVSFVRPAFDGLVGIVNGVVDGFKSAFSSFRSFGEGLISVVQSIFSGVALIPSIILNAMEIAISEVAIDIRPPVPPIDNPFIALTDIDIMPREVARAIRPLAIDSYDIPSITLTAAVRIPSEIAMLSSEFLFALSVKLVIPSVNDLKNPFGPSLIPDKKSEIALPMSLRTPTNPPAFCTSS